MRSHQIVNTPVAAECFDDAEYPIPEHIATLKADLIAAKSMLDEPYRDRRYQPVFNILDYYRPLRLKVSIEYNTPNVSNAWLKMYELLSHFPLVTESTKTAFLNSELPGSFILSLHHYTKTNGLNVNWMASSIVETDPSKNYFEDRYRLVANYPERWLMDPASERGKPGYNNGNTTDPGVIEDFRRKVLARTEGRGVDLYTSDIGIDVSEDYGNQELIESKLLLGSAVAMLRTLSLRGSMALKTFTLYEPITVSIIRLLSALFERFNVCKPASSRPSNSEVYLVGLGFRGVDERTMQTLSDRLANFNHRPLLTHACTYGDKVFMAQLEQSYDIHRMQARTLREYVGLYQRYRDDIPGLIRRWKKHKRDMIARYIASTRIQPMKDSDRLRVREEIVR